MISVRRLVKRQIGHTTRRELESASTFLHILFLAGSHSNRALWAKFGIVLSIFGVKRASQAEWNRASFRVSVLLYQRGSLICCPRKKDEAMAKIEDAGTNPSTSHGGPRGYQCLEISSGYVTKAAAQKALNVIA
jgi:hypothetical protein